MYEIDATRVLDALDEHLIMRGALATAAKELAGYRDISTTMRNIHQAPSVLTDAIALLNGRGLSVPRGDNGEMARR